VDQGGRPIEDVLVNFVVEGATLQKRTRNGGWATVTAPWPKGKSYVVAEIQVGDLKRRTIILPGDRAEAAAGSPDLLTDLVIPIRPGRIHGLSLAPQPRELTNDGQTGTVEVWAEDKQGRVISSPDILIDVSSGAVGPVQYKANGVAVVTFSPEIGAPPGLVRVTASTGDGRFSASTQVSVIHPEQSWSVGLKGGLLVGSGGLMSPYFGSFVERKTPVSFLFGRLSFATFWANSEDRDPVTGDRVNMSMQAFPIGFGGVFRRGVGRFPFWGGAQVVMAPYRLDVAIDQDQQGAWNWMSPGAAVNTGVAMRVLGGEVFAELEYLFLASPGQAYGWTGPVGGVVAGLGFKLIY
jgi:hypothetical protein